MFAAFLIDLKHAFRTLRRSPRDTIVAAAILALGIGANTAMFSAVNHVLWRAFPFADEQHLVRLREMVTGADGQPHPFNMSSQPIIAVRDHSHEVFDGLIAMSGQSMSLLSGEHPERVSVVLQTAGFEDTLRVQPIVGRSFTAGEEQLGIESGVALISHAMAQTRFGGPKQAIGRQVRLEDRTFTVVGVMPPAYAFPYDAKFWIPWRLDAADQTRDFAVWAHVRPSSTMLDVRRAMDRVAAEIRQNTPGTLSGYSLEIRGIRENLLGDQQRSLLALTEIVGFMLLIAVVNVATLLLARSVNRQREFAIRAAIGESWRRHLSRLLAESVVLACIGGAGGLLLTIWFGAATTGLVPVVLRDQLGLSSPQVDWRVTVFAIAVSFVAAIVAAMIPALSSWRIEPQVVLSSGRAATIGRRGRIAFNLLIVAETALTLVLLVGAGLVIRDFLGLQRQALGFEAHGLLAVELTPPSPAYRDGVRRSELVHRLIERILAAPEVARAGITTVNPLGGGTWGAAVVSDLSEDVASAINVNHRLISPGLLEAMSIPLLRGRAFTLQDRTDTQPVAIVSNRLARRLWPNQDAIGRRIRIARAESPWLIVVGIVGDVADAHDPGVPQDTWYLPFDQHAESAAAEHIYLMIRDSDRPLALVPEVQHAIASVDATLAPYNPVAMDEYFNDSIGRERMSAWLMFGFGSFGLLLAGLGVYGVMTLVVSQRTVEFGIRRALGATMADIIPLALNRSLTMVGAGVAVGITIALVLNRSLATLLTEVGSVDLATLFGAALLIIIAATTACLIPAFSAARRDPGRILRG